jgi:Xaa-Pro dipeptidase
MSANALDHFDIEALLHYRQGRVRTEMAERGIDALILSDAVNIRYATGTRNMAVFTSRNPASRYCFLPVEGDVVMFEFTGSRHLSVGLSTVQEVRAAQTASFVAAGPANADAERRWAGEMAELITERCGRATRIGVEPLNAGSAAALSAHGFELVDAQEPVERARSIKSVDEIVCIKESLRATEAAATSREHFTPAPIHRRAGNGSCTTSPMSR